MKWTHRVRTPEPRPECTTVFLKFATSCPYLESPFLLHVSDIFLTAKRYPFGVAPTLEFDDVVLPESIPLSRYLASELGKSS